MAVQDTNYNIRVSLTLRDAFYRQCERNSANPSDLLRRLMGDYASGRITYTPVKRGKPR